MTVREYYYKHFSELNSDKQFHFATRIKNYFKTHDFDEYFKNNRPNSDVAKIISNNDYSRVSNLQLRKPFFEKYPDLYGVEAALFRVHHLLAEYGLDLRDKFLELYPKKQLYNLSDNLIQDEEAFKILSTWAINAIYLTEELFPRGENVIKRMSEMALNLDLDSTNPTILSYLYTHIILCESDFYTKNLMNSENLELMKQLLKKCAEVINKNIDTMSLDACVEFLVCSNMVGVDYPDLRAKIAEICTEFRKNSPYVINYRRDSTPGSYFHTLNGAEHINVLYIMSGLDL